MTPIDTRHALDALFAIDPGCSRDEWHAIGRAAIAAGLSVDDLVQWSEPASNYRGDRDVRSAFRGITANGPTTPATLWRAALDAGWRPPKDGQPIAAQVPRIERPPQPARRDDTPLQVLSAQRLAWFDALAAPAGPALAYLQARRCVIPPADSDLRWHEALRHPCGHVGPALVALVTDARTREPLTLHRTWIQRDGTKAPEADPPRLLLGGHRKAGGVIRLWPDEAVTTGLALAEGVETALSLAHVHRPAWACIDAGNLATLPVLAGVECLVIGADHDAAGIKASTTCAERWAAAGADVAVVLPRVAHQDLNDLRAAA